MGILTIICIIFSVAAIVAAAVMAYRAMRFAPAVAWLALAILMVAIEDAPGWPTVAFWGVAAIIAVAITTLLPAIVATSRNGVAFMTTGAFAGAFVGMLLPYANAGMILGALIGTACGLIVHSRTPAGAILGFPSKKFFKYACAKGLPTVVTACACALAALSIVQLIH